MSNQYKKDNDIVYKSYLERNWFSSWRLPRGESLNNLVSLEIYLTTDCNLGCTYCYLNRHEDNLYSPELRQSDNILQNLDLLLNWVIENKFTPGLEFYSGGSLESELGFDALNLIYEKFSKIDLDFRPPYITIPTNYSFILDDQLIDKVEKIIENIKSLEINIFLSASIDGKFLEKKNRPFRSFERMLKTHSGLFRPEEDNRDDVYYDKLFAFNVKHHFGFHPMVYSYGIELWKDNFLWFQEMFEKFNINFQDLYLLEVRNAEWNEHQIQEFLNFIDFLIKWSWNKLNYDVDKFINFLINDKGFNILTDSLFLKTRGSGCGLQTSLYVRAGDLAIVGCHRQSYDGYEFGKFVVENNRIVDIESINLEFALGIAQYNMKSAPYCESCAIKDICMGSCLGSSLEVTGDAFTPVPVVCELTHRKIIQTIISLKEIGVYQDLLNVLDHKIVDILTYLEKEIK